MSISNMSVCEEKVFKNIFEQNSRIIRNFIYYKCGDIEQAEDLTQDAFIQLWNNCKKIPFDKAKSFVMKVAQNSFFNNVRHQKVVLHYNKNEDKKDCDHESPEYILEEKEFLEKLSKCISELPDKEREVFLLSRKEKKTYREIAEIIGISQKGVERRMHLALKKLKEKLGTNI